MKNLTLAGSMTVTQPNPGVAGTLAIYNNGAALTGVTNTATVTYSADKTNSTSGYLGGLVGQDKAGSTYTDCHNTGMFNIPGSGRTMFIGGIVGGALINTKGSLTNCSNSGKFEFNFSNKPDSGMFGGLVGSAEKAFWNFTDCTNEGNFSVTFADPGHQYHSLGGILGNGYGTFVRCINKGDITFGTAKGTNYRRTGGIIGCVGANDDAIDFQRTLSMSDCRNEGDLAASTASLGGIIGIAEKIDTPAVIENCENKGHISSPSMADYDVYYFGGIAGKVNGAFTLRNCVNRGNLTAAVERDIAGIAVSGRQRRRLRELRKLRQHNCRTQPQAQRRRPVASVRRRHRSDRERRRHHDHQLYQRLRHRRDGLPCDEYRQGLRLPEDLGKWYGGHEDRLRRSVEEQFGRNDDQYYHQRVNLLTLFRTTIQS